MVVTNYFFFALMYSPRDEWEARQGLGDVWENNNIQAWI